MTRRPTDKYARLDRPAVLKAAMADRKLKGRALAAAAGYSSPGLIYRLLNGKSNTCPVRTATAIENLVGVEKIFSIHPAKSPNLTAAPQPKRVPAPRRAA